MKIIISLVFSIGFISLASSQISDTDSDLESIIYRTKLSRDFNSTFLQSLTQKYSDGKSFLTYELDSAFKLISYQLYFNSGEIAVDSRLLSFSKNEDFAEQFSFETITYYKNGNHRTVEFNGVFQALKIGYNIHGNQVYKSQIVNSDTLSGLFLKHDFKDSEIYYAYYEDSVLKYSIVVEPYTFRILKIYKEGKKTKLIKRKKIITMIYEIFEFR